MILYKIIKVYQKIPVEEDKKHQINKTKTVKKAKKVGRPKMKEEDKKNDPMFGIRIDQEVKDFYLSYRGLAKRVLMDFYYRVDGIKFEDRKNQQKSEELKEKRDKNDE